MKQKLKRFMAGFMAVLTMVMTLFTNGSTAFAASPQANIAFWYASTKNSGEVSELKAGYNHGKILYSILDGNSAYCMNFGLKADGGQLMNSYDDTSTSMSTEQRKLLSYCLYYGFNSTQKAAPSNSQCDEYIATQAMVWIIVANIFGTGSGDSAAQKLCNTAPNPTASYNYYESLKNNISSSYNATLPSFASRTGTGAPTYELKWNEANQRFETTLSDSNGVLGEFDFSIDGYSVSKNGNSITIASANVNTNATTGKFVSNAGKVETTSSCVFWLTGKSGYQEFISEKPTADPVKAYIKVKTENIGYGEITKTDESSGVKLSGAVYGIYSDSGCTNRVQTMTTDGNGYAKSAALVAGTYYVKEITAPKGYVLSDKVHTLTVRAGQTTGISATDKEQLGAITIYKEGEVLSAWNGSNFIYEKKKLPGATFKVTAGADIYKADGTKDIAKTALLAKEFREAGQTAANAFRTFADKLEVDYSQKEQKHPITKAVLAPMKAVKKMLVSMKLHLDASIDKLDNLAIDVRMDKEKHMENAKVQEQTEPERAEAERVEAEIVYSPMVAEPQEYQYNADAFEARGVDEVKQEAAHKEVSKVREDKAR